ncbi:ABC transporter permease [Sphaerisporangium corydalis]|uniref:ABC transporter permease n=1 Tax=Sphaerisporangium corydalis TaxID=1441875 RepID=A0ABV9E8V8_9ACTN|nr:ABC-2 family transporter protein [Sphaerisporangium corydalis]
MWEARPGLAGYDVVDAITFCFLTQAFIGPMEVFGGGLDLAQRVRTGDVALDLVRPASLQFWTMADDLGRAAFLFFARSVPPTVAGALIFGIRVPADPVTWAAFLASMVLGIMVSFGLRYLVALSTCWLVDDRGLQSMSLVMTTFFSGMVVPLVILPGWLATVAQALPWSAMVQVPADVFLGKRDPLGALAFQAAWVAVVLGAGALVTRSARRKVVIQGG